MLAAIPSVCAAAKSNAEQRPSPAGRISEFVRLTDPVTETPVLRLTDPRSANVLPFAQNRFISSKRRFLIFSSDRSGKPCPFQVDLRSGALHQLTDTEQLAPRSLAMDAHERSAYYIDGAVLKELSFASRKTRTVAEGVTAFGIAGSSSDLCAFVQGKLKHLTTGRILAQDAGDFVLMRPGGAGCLFVQELDPTTRSIWYADIAGASPPLLLAKGSVSDPFWSPDGESILFLSSVDRGVRISEIHEVSVRGGDERVIAPTSQFASFAPNENGSVFAGASGSKAQPNVVLLIRSVRRELTLCEHRATNAAAVSPVFSADSRRVYFGSDREGKSSIYSVNLELLVEPTPVQS